MAKAIIPFEFRPPHKWDGNEFIRFMAVGFSQRNKDNNKFALFKVKE